VGGTNGSRARVSRIEKKSPASARHGGTKVTPKAGAEEYSPTEFRDVNPTVI